MVLKVGKDDSQAATSNSCAPGWRLPDLKYAAELVTASAGCVLCITAPSNYIWPLELNGSSWWQGQ